MKAPCWTKVTEHLLRYGEISHGTVLSRAMQLLYDDTGKWCWPEIPEEYWLYSLAMFEEESIRGIPAMLIFILLALIALVVDIVYPDLFFKLKHGYMVDGGEPSDLYRMGQMLGRGMLIVAVIVFAVLSFKVH